MQKHHRKRQWTRETQEPPPLDPESLIPPAPAPEPELAPAPASAPASLLDGTIAQLVKSLETGEHDEDLAALLEQERAKQNRKGAIAAIEERIALTAETDPGSASPTPVTPQP
jgi:hypothetical protein